MNAAARSMLSGSSFFDERKAESTHIRTYNWPPLQLNFWIFVMLMCSATIIGVFGDFMSIQHQLDQPIPWYFPYYVTVGAICIVYIIGMFVLIFKRRLLPALVMIGAFMVFVMWLVGLVVTSTQLWGPSGNVQGQCDMYVFNQSPHGRTQETMAWLQQRTICQCWHLVFAMALTGQIFLFWIMIMAYQVFANS